MGLIGSGTIGTLLSHAIDEGRAGNAKPLAVYDRMVDKAENLSTNISRVNSKFTLEASKVALWTNL